MIGSFVLDVLTLSLASVNTAAVVVAVVFTWKAAKAGLQATEIAHQTGEVGREGIRLQERVRLEEKKEWMRRRLLRVADCAVGIGDRARRVEGGQPSYLLVQAVNALQAALLGLSTALPECRRLAGTHQRPAEAHGAYMLAVYEIEKALADLDEAPGDTA